MFDGDKMPLTSLQFFIFSNPILQSIRIPERGHRCFGDIVETCYNRLRERAQKRRSTIVGQNKQI